MISWSSESSLPLQTAPGATLRFRVLSVIERNRANSRVPREIKQQMTEATVELRPFRDAIADQEKRRALAPADEATVSVLLDTVESLEWAHTVPAFIREGLIAIDGLEIDGEPVTARTVDKFLGSAPASVVGEVYGAIISASALNPEQQKNSQSPSTSSSLAQGDQASTTAGTASETGSTTPATASATSPAMS